MSLATNLVPGDTNGVYDVFLHDLSTGATTRVSVDSSGSQGNGSSTLAAISSDGRFVAFSSSASNLVPQDTNGKPDIFVHDCTTGVTTRVSVDSSGIEGNGWCAYPSISADGRYVAFQSDSTNLVAGGTDGSNNVYVRDRLTRQTTLVSVDLAGAPGNSHSYLPSISGDGRYVAYHSDASNLVSGDTNGVPDVFVYDRSSSHTTRISVNSAGLQGNAASVGPSISADGRYVVFCSNATNLVAGDTNGHEDVFVHEMLTGVTRRVSVSSTGTQGDTDSITSNDAAITADGRFVVFMSYADNLVPGDFNHNDDVFLHDMLTGTTTRVSLGSGSTEDDGDATSASISADGRCVAFDCAGTNLVPDDNNGFIDVFVRDRGATSSFTTFCFGDGAVSCPCGNQGSLAHGCDNSASTGGAMLAVTGTASLSSDTVQLAASGELPTGMSIILQGSSSSPPIGFGDGLRCVGGNLKRLYLKASIGGATNAPQSGDASISARSAALGDTIPLGASRIYQVYYRDSNLTFCPGGFNVTNAIAVAWGF